MELSSGKCGSRITDPWVDPQCGCRIVFRLYLFSIVLLNEKLSTSIKLVTFSMGPAHSIITPDAEYQY